MLNRFKELVIGTHGARGAGKDAFDAWVASCYMLANVPCYSNMPVEGVFDPYTYRPTMKGHPLYRVKSQELQVNNLYTFGQDFEHDTLLYLSEVDKIIHRRRSISTANMLLNVLATQIRKAGVTIVANAQDWFWLDDEWVFQTDILANCSDLAFTPWGHEEGLKEGWITYVELYDISGVATGYRYRDTGRPYARFRFGTRAMWDRSINGQGPIFDSGKILGVEQMMSKIVLDREEVHISKQGQYQDVPTFEGKDFSMYRGNIPGSKAQVFVQNAINALRGQGVDEISNKALGDILYQAGYQGPAGMIGKYVKRIAGIESYTGGPKGEKGTRYLLQPAGVGERRA